MTEKLYDQDAYAVEFDAKVISCEAYQEKRADRVRIKGR